jgi:hypothetical protein
VTISKQLHFTEIVLQERVDTTIRTDLVRGCIITRQKYESKSKASVRELTAI